MITIYGIPNCDTMKKARRWLADHGVDAQFHNYRTAGIDADTLAHWCDRVDWRSLLNTRGATWRKLPEAQRSDITQARAIALMAANPTLIKRPVLITDDGAVHVGFQPQHYAALFTP